MTKQTSTTELTVTEAAVALAVETPDVALQVLTDLRATLTALELDHVSALHQQGETWRRIGALLDISGSAAHQRFAHRM